MEPSCWIWTYKLIGAIAVVIASVHVLRKLDWGWGTFWITLPLLGFAVGMKFIRDHVIFNKHMHADWWVKFLGNDAAWDFITMVLIVTFCIGVCVKCLETERKLKTKT